MNPIAKWTLKQRKVSTLWWSAGIALFMFINMIFYPSFKNDAAELEKSFENIPDAALQLLGGSSDFFSPVGFVNSQIYFLMLPLLLGVLAIALGSRLLAKEETDLTIESLLSRPVSRAKLLYAKACAGSIILLFVSVVSWLTIIGLANLVNLEVSSGALTKASLVCFLLVFAFGSIAFMFSATGRAKGASIGVTSFLAFGGYIIASLASTVSWLSAPAKLFPFHYYQSEAILRGTYNWNNLWYFIVVIAFFGVVSWLVFRRRDIA